MTEGVDKKNIQPGLESKKGPVAEKDYKKIASAGAVTMLEKGNALVAKAMTAINGGNMLAPQDVLELVQDGIIPHAQAIVDGLGGEDPRGEASPKPVDSGNEGKSELDDDETAKKIASLTASVDSLMKENLTMKKASLAKEYGTLFPPHMRAAAEKEINDSEDDYNMLQAKVAGATKVIKAAKDGGMIKPPMPTNFNTYGPLKSAKAEDSKTPLPAYLR